MTLFDVAFLILLFVVQPWQGRRAWLQLQKLVAQGEELDRIALYIQTIVAQWIAFILLILLWWFLDRPLAWLGVHGTFGPGFWLVAGLGALASLMFGIMAFRMRNVSAAIKHAKRNKLGELTPILPQSDRELRMFFGVSLTAGVVEELIYRGFVLWILSQWLPLWAAVLLSSMGFGLAHSYQGLRGMLRTGLMGFLFAIVFIASGSIWLPMLFHAIFDLLMGVRIRELFRDHTASAQQG